MRITIAQCCDGSNGWLPLRNLTWPITQRYCAMHGYTCVQDTVADTRGRKALTWGKVATVRRCLKDADWVLWLDTDAVIVNLNMQVEDILAGRNKFCFLIAADINGLNGGVFLIQNKSWSFELIRCLTEYKPKPKDTLQDTLALHRIIGVHGEKEQKRVLVISKRTFNSYPKADWLWYEGDYEHGDFIAHAPGMSVSDKIRLLEPLCHK